MVTTDSHVYFVGGYLSNFYGCRFTMAPYPGMEPLEFNCSEQAFMLLKALTFGDFLSANAIMRSDIPSDQKALGRKVKGFDDGKWRAVSRECMFRATQAKFEQNVDLVEAAHYDRVWGVGLREADPLILDEANWLGTNWLGENHMALRLHFAMSDPSREGRLQEALRHP